jgi:hypothetical protein
MEVFFGFVSSGEIASASFELSSPEEFRIIDTTCDDPYLQISTDVTKLKNHRIKLQLNTAKQRGTREGKIQITTDLTRQKLCEVRYYVYVE